MLLIIAGTAGAASFDCTKAASAVEKAICSDDKISELDSQLMLSYKKSMSTAVNADALKLQQRAWLANVRNKCQDAACLKLAYADRIAQLDSASTPVPVQPSQNVQVASVADQTKANAVAESATSQSKTIASVPIQPDATQSTPQEVKVDSTVQAAAPSSPSPKEQNTPAASEPSSEAESSPASASFKLPFTLSDVFHLLFALGIISLIAGVIRPSLAGRFINGATRKRVAISMLVFLVPVAALSELTKTPEEKEHDLMVKQEREAESQRKVSAQNYSPEDGNDYNAKVNQFTKVMARARSSNSPACESLLDDYGNVVGKMNDEMQNAGDQFNRDHLALANISILNADIATINSACN